MWKNEIKSWNDFNWLSLKAELDYMTFNRFTPFFCKNVLCCDNLYKEFAPFIAMNMELLDRSKDELFKGSVISRQGTSGSVGGANYSISGIATLKGYGTIESPTVLPQLYMLLHKYGLMYPSVRNNGVFTCGACSSCVSGCSDCSRCNGDDC